MEGKNRLIWNTVPNFNLGLGKKKETSSLFNRGVRSSAPHDYLLSHFTLEGLDLPQCTGLVGPICQLRWISKCIFLTILCLLNLYSSKNMVYFDWPTVLKCKDTTRSWNTPYTKNKVKMYKQYSDKTFLTRLGSIIFIFYVCLPVLIAYLVRYENMYTLRIDKDL